MAGPEGDATKEDRTCPEEDKDSMVLGRARKNGL